MHEEQFRVHNHEIDELSKRNNHLHEQNVRLDIECGRVTDELQVALGRTEQLRNECANLRAEKKIWEVSLYRFPYLGPSLNLHYRVFKADWWRKIDHWPWNVLILPT